MLIRLDGYVAWVGDGTHLGLREALSTCRGALILNAVVVAEVAPRFERIETLRAALPSMALIEEIPLAAAFLAGHAHANYRRAGGPREAILPDFLIGAHAAVTGRPLLTRDPRRVAAYIPGALLIAPDNQG